MIKFAYFHAFLVLFGCSLNANAEEIKLQCDMRIEINSNNFMRQDDITATVEIDYIPALDIKSISIKNQELITHIMSGSDRFRDSSNPVKWEMQESFNDISKNIAYQNYVRIERTNGSIFFNYIYQTNSESIRKNGTGFCSKLDKNKLKF
jgi:hypothetical protein